MAGIWNVNSVYNSNLRKVSSKLSFELGENFAARVVSTDEENSEILLKLLDGWQFPARIEKPLDFIPKGLIRFQVTGFENGKLKLKLMGENEQGAAPEDSSLEGILLENNIDPSEYLLLEKMIRHNLPLTRGNISRVKTLLDFAEKLKSNPEEGEMFVERYLESRNISITSLKGREIKDLLSEFFSQLKTLDGDDLLMLIENNIDLTPENINSFNKLFKQELGLYRDFERPKSLEEHGAPVRQTALEEERADGDTGDLIPKSIEMEPEADTAVTKAALKEIIRNTVREFIGKEIDFNPGLQKNIEKCEVKLAGIAEKALGPQGNIIDEKEMEQVTRALQAEIKNVERDLKALIKASVGSNVRLMEQDFERMASEVENRVHSAEVKAVKDKGQEAVHRVEQQTAAAGGELEKRTAKELKQLVNNYLPQTDKAVNGKNQGLLEVLRAMVREENDVRQQLKDIIASRMQENSGKNYSTLLSKVEAVTDESVVRNLEKVMESRGNELAVYQREESPDSVLRPSRDDIRTVIAEALSGDLELTDDECDVLLKNLENKLNEGTDNRIIKGHNDIKPMLKGSSELVKEQVSVKTDDIKAVLREIIAGKSEQGPEFLSRIIEGLKSNMNDFKVFNSISNQYYYMDLPLRLKDNDYPCKIIIKDDRKKGKKIDSKNVKLVVSVNTINMGAVDSFIKVKDSSMSITIKCDEKWVEVLNMAKEKLVKSLSEIEYNLYIAVEEKEKDVTITSCREFFDEGSLGNINIRV